MRLELIWRIITLLKEVRIIYTIDQYAYVSRLRSLNPRLKALGAIAALIFCVAADRIWVSVFVLLSMSAFTVFLGGLSWKKYLRLLKIPLAFLFLGTAAIVTGISAGNQEWTFLRIGGISFYLVRGGPQLAFRLILKAMGAVSAMYMLVLSTPASEVISVFGHLRVPGVFLELMNMIYRFIFVMMDTQCRMRDAAESRLGYRDFYTACRSFGSTAGNLFVVSLKKAGTYYDAMTARCYDGELKFLEEDKPVKGWQKTAFICYFLLLAGVWSLL